MRASLRRIDITEQSTAPVAWPSMDWLAGPGEPTRPAPLRGPRGRGGLWAAMASAVDRAREGSQAASGRSGPDELHLLAQLDDELAGGEMIDLVDEAPHLAYLARVAAGTDQAEIDDAQDGSIDDRPFGFDL